MGAPAIRVLVVDDEPDFAEALVARLRRRGFEATFALSGHEALARLGGGGFEVVLLDLKMPSMDGLETIRRIQDLDPLLQTVLLTGHGSAGAGIEGMQIGAVDFLQKPVAIEILCNVLTAAAQKGRGLRAETAAGKTAGKKGAA
jgi:DNA-binding NtrC family response regulator